MEPLAPEDFDAFFEALWGYPAFPWQRRLAHRLIADRGWPEALDLPTAAGKTAVLDIAVFHLAVEAEAHSARTAPLRILYVVDRRLVVDTAYERARTIARRLAESLGAGPETGVLRRVAVRLASLAGPDEVPLRVARLRGGMPREPDWARTPCQPTIAISTVDQAGSRLLFRGYGVSDSMKPVHAGLMGADALFLLDEAHLSQPFRQTLDGIRMYAQPPWTEQRGPAPLSIVSLSATLPETGPAPFRLDDADRDHEELSRRLTARKHARLVRAAAGLDETDRLAAEVAAQAITLSPLAPQPSGAIVIAVVLNRVALARAVFEALERRTQDDAGHRRADAALLIGRSRPLDREDLLRGLLPRMQAQGRKDAGPLFIVTTQSVEVGADLDFDALVTQIAPLDSLRQRFGRLDRLGRRGESEAVVFAAKDEIGARANDPLYGRAPAETWTWLAENETVEGRGKAKRVYTDFGTDALDALLRASSPDCEFLLAPRNRAPVLLPRYVELWSETKPIPAVNPEPALFLHGPADTAAEVQIVWRADLTEEMLGNELGAETSERPSVLAAGIVAAIPPSSLEAVSVPVGAARRWLRRQSAPYLYDVEGRAEAGEEGGPIRRGRPALRWRNTEGSAVVLPGNVRPGDTLVVPAAYGGCDAFGWTPAASAPVRDRAEAAHLAQRGRLALRLTPALLRHELAHEGRAEEAARIWARVAAAIGEHREAAAELPAGLADLLDELPLLWAEWLGALPAVRPRLDDPYPDEQGIVLSGAEQIDRGRRARLLDQESDAETEGSEAATEDDRASLYTGVEVDLARHSVGVRERARAYAERAGLGADRVRDIALAAWLHDAGKAERRFQTYLRGGDEIAALRAEASLAKSAARYRTRADERAARTRARLPDGARHEAASVHFAAAHPKLAEAADPDLVLYLIGTHHGWGRPFFPAAAYPAPGTGLEADLGDGPVRAAVAGPSVTRLDSGWAERFALLRRRYGTWELARFEAILRLADHRQSEAEQRDTQTGDSL